jgi:hypothetical protein
LFVAGDRDRVNPGKCAVTRSNSRVFLSARLFAPLGWENEFIGSNGDVEPVKCRIDLQKKQDRATAIGESQQNKTSKLINLLEQG